MYGPDERVLELMPPSISSPDPEGIGSGQRAQNHSAHSKRSDSRARRRCRLD